MEPLPLNQRIISGMALARLNELYSRVLGDRFAKGDLIIRCLAAIMATGALVSWAADLPAPWSSLWRVALILTAISSALSPILRLDDHARRWRELAGRWTLLMGRFRQLSETEAPDSEKLPVYLRLMAEADDLQGQDLTAENRKLSEAMTQRVRQQMGLPMPPAST